MSSVTSTATGIPTSQASRRTEACRCCVGLGNGTFDPGVDLPGGDGSGSDRRHRPRCRRQRDIVLTHAGSTDMGTGSDDIVVQLSQGDGPFDTRVRPSGVNPQAVVVGDFNSDEKPDLATANTASTCLLPGERRRDVRRPGELSAGCALSFGDRHFRLQRRRQAGPSHHERADREGQKQPHRIHPVGRGDGTFDAPDDVNGRRSAADHALGGRLERRRRPDSRRQAAFRAGCELVARPGRWTILASRRPRPALIRTRSWLWTWTATGIRISWRGISARMAARRARASRSCSA